MSVFTQEEIDKVTNKYNVRTVEGIRDALKDLTKDMLQKALEAELEDSLGYAKYELEEKQINNSRNGHYNKKVDSESGPIELSIPRDRNGEHEPLIVKKHARRISGIEEKVIALFARGNSLRDIRELMHDMYGIEVSAEMVSKITDKLHPEIMAWQSRPLQAIYPILYLDALNLNIRQDGKTLKKAVYLALGVDMDGQKDVLGIWVGGNESSKFWLSILSEIKNRGVQDILICCVDGLKGFQDAIQAAFPDTIVQRCIVHQIRYACKYVSYKDRKVFCADMKTIYTAPSEEVALQALFDFEQKWGKQYGYAVKSWQDNWSELASFFQFSSEIRKLIYTTNAIENLNSSVKRFTNPKRLFPSDDAAIKSVFCAVRNQLNKWLSPRNKIKDWGIILSQLQIHFAVRLKEVFLS